MQEPRPLLEPASPELRLRRRLYGALILAGLALALAAALTMPPSSANDRQGVRVLASAAWLIGAYLFARRGRLYLAGAMVVALAVAALALALALLPSMALLPLAWLPAGLAALLLDRRAIYVAAAATILALAGAAMAAAAPALISSLNLTALAIFALAVMLASLRAEIATLFDRLRVGDLARAYGEAERATIESARAGALARLDYQRRNVEALAEQISDGLIAVSPDGQVDRANQVALAIWAEMGAGELIGQQFEQLQATLAGAAAAIQDVAIVELPPEARERDPIYTHILRDRREQARYTRLREELLGLLAAEMRDPLTSMVTALEMTLGQEVPDGVDRVLMGARRSGQRLLDLVSMLAEISQIERDPSALHRSATPLRPVLESGIAQTAPLAQQGAVTVVVEYSGDGTIMLDGERMRRAFANLLERALRQSPPYSSVQVRTERQNGAVVVRISDQGPGLTPQQREALFGQSSVTEERTTPILGLTFSKLVIESHGGRVWVESDGSQGCTYAFSLPVEPSGASSS